MSDFQGRGRGGGRGNRGRGRGDGGGRGDFQGHGRGRGGATFSGFQGGDAQRGRGRGRGDFGSDRGRGGGYNRDKFPGEQIVFNPNSIPRPDATITQLEDNLVKGQGVSALTAKMGKVQISAAQDPKDSWFPRRPAFGTQGASVILWANYFKLDASAKVALLKYSLKVSEKSKPKDPSKETPKGKGAKGGQRKPREAKGKKLHSIIKSALDQVAGSVTFATEFKDQVISLAPFTLPDDHIVTVQYRDEGRDDVYEVKFHGPTTVDLPGLFDYLKTMQEPAGEVTFPKYADAIDAISIITGFYARSNEGTAALGRSRYFPLKLANEQYELGYPDFNRIIRGYFQSARPATGRLLLNANVAHGVFRPKGLVSDLIDQFNHNYAYINKSLGKLRGQCKVLSEDKDPKKTRFYQKLICGLADPSDGTGSNRPKVRERGAGAKDVQFYLQAPAPAGLQGNAYCSVADYYKKRYGYNVNPKYPVVNIGTKARPVYMPAEFVEVIDGQALRRKTTPDETRGMINFSCHSPYANATSISTYGRQVLGLDNPECLSRFGINVDKTLLTVQGRELLPPTIVYKDVQQPNKDKIVVTRDGEWNMENVRVFKPGRRIDRWFWISIDSGNRAHQRHNDVANNMRAWVQFLQKQGINMAADPLKKDLETRVTVRGSPADAVRAVFKDMEPFKPQLVFVVLPGRKTDTAIYNAVKKLGDVDFGYLTQNILQQNLIKNNSQVYANLGLKVNLKMGGINHRLRDDVTIIKQHPTMVVGYDVTHPTNLAGNKQGLPSLVGLVASIDEHLGQWPAASWAQDGRVEMLSDILETAFADRLQLYRQHNRRLPECIIIFRDGVSEGQFQKVLEDELPYMRKACEKVYPATQRPKISIIVSVKRHQTRFYPTDQRHMVNSRNIKNGTVVDRGVTLAGTWDFFLTAHKGLQGTSRPAHYTVLIDEVFRNLSRDQAVNQLEKLTYEMCHLFGRATKAVSICPPAYYADILCTRSRVYLSDLFENSDTVSLASSPNTDVPSVNVHESLKNTMYYI
ncbi:ribonuclease H-like domain-containing protein [Xylaria bambusicola]|uniref:ribonuclease H-like domain-containing protein n=1 Tax=Xylaria bambusicola TaxID=326684 RepID=UPI002008249C|nr:ribonuclease H-like domain-containing protein [Xylaria bambusicola]KAI0518080.1 ribonuclease H-like domain-containing protein [Xylaria bambusicola]